jgi:hypothetical protein
MNNAILREKLENHICHIHKQPATFTMANHGALEIHTCCILFNKQLNLMADKYADESVNSKKTA